MSMCLAFTKAGKPCKNFGELLSQARGATFGELLSQARGATFGELLSQARGATFGELPCFSESEVVYSCTCVHHRNYFEEHLDEWKSRIGHYALWNRTARYQFDMLLKTKQVVLEKEDDLIQGSTFIRYYTSYAKYVDDFHISWNKQNFENAVLRKFTGWYSDFEGILALAHCSSHETIIQIITCELVKMKKDGNGNVPRVEGEIDSWLQYALENDRGLLNDSKTCSQIQKILKDCVSLIQEAKFLSYINKFRRIEMKEKKVILLEFKEELMASTWHPSRVMKWCIDVEEQKEWQSFEGERSSSSNAA